MISESDQKLGIAYHRFTTDRPLELALFDLLRSRMGRGRKGRRAAIATSRSNR